VVSIGPCGGEKEKTNETIDIQAHIQCPSACQIICKIEFFFPAEFVESTKTQRKSMGTQPDVKAEKAMKSLPNSLFSHFHHYV
jgi:hypothetical protein